MTMRPLLDRNAGLTLALSLAISLAGCTGEIEEQSPAPTPVRVQTAVEGAAAPSFSALWEANGPRSGHWRNT